MAKFLQRECRIGMKRLLVISLLLATVIPAAGQHVQAAMRKAKEREEAMARRILMDEGGSGLSGYLSYRVMDGDTMYFDTIDPVWIFSRKQQKDWKKYYKLVYNFARVYPYAQASGRLQEIVDSTITANNYGRMKKDRYMNEVQSMLFKDFEGALRKMTISQGAVLLKLIDRETGQSSYSIIHDYKNGIAAGFWQGVAKLFDNDLKSEYDPEGADRETMRRAVEASRGIRILRQDRWEALCSFIISQNNASRYFSMSRQSAQEQNRRSQHFLRKQPA